MTGYHGGKTRIGKELASIINDILVHIIQMNFQIRNQLQKKQDLIIQLKKLLIFITIFQM